MRKNVGLLFATMFLISTCVGTVDANPYMFHEFVDDPLFVTPPIIKVASPQQNATYTNNGTITLCFSVTGPDASNLLTKYLSMVDYQGDWMPEAKHAYRTKNYDTYTPDDFPFQLSFNFNVTRIPQGKHSLVITALGSGGYADGLTWYSFSKNSSVSVNFAIGKIPVVTLLPFENTTFNTTSVPLNFTVDQMVSNITYGLDGARAVAIGGNTTLTGLSNGSHNVTVYATNEYENTGSSETVNFTVNYVPPKNVEPYVVVPVALGLGLSVAIAVVGLFIIPRRKKHREVL